MTLDASTVAHDALAAAGFMIRGVNLSESDELRARLAKHFAPAARTYAGDVDRLREYIRPRLPAAIDACQPHPGNHR